MDFQNNVDIDLAFDLTVYSLTSWQKNVLLKDSRSQTAFAGSPHFFQVNTVAKLRVMLAIYNSAEIEENEFLGEKTCLLPLSTSV